LSTENVINDKDDEPGELPSIFLSYQWAHQPEMKLLRRHLGTAGYASWMDVGQMGGGDKLFAKIDAGIRAAKVVICCVTNKYAESPNCNKEVSLWTIFYRDDDYDDLDNIYIESSSSSSSF